MSTAALRRSALYTPGANRSALAKAIAGDADVAILDLEDAVAPQAKHEARANVVQALQAPRPPQVPELAVRVNGLDTPWCESDVRAIAPLAPAAIVFPKIERAGDVDRAHALLERHGAPVATRLWCMIETPRAILDADALGARCAQAGSRVDTWVLGTNDLAKALRATLTPEREALSPSLAVALLAARAWGLLILDGVHNDLRDADGLARACRQAAIMGFDGKTLIHPVQVDACHRAFTPDAGSIAQAREIVAAFERPEHAHAGVLQVGGRMVERLHLEIARRTLAIDEAIALRRARSVREAARPSS